MKWDRQLQVILLWIGLFAGSLFASQTRIETMGYLSNFYVRDSYNIWAFPSAFVGYDNMVIAESSYGNELWSGGVHIPVNRTFSLGVYLRDTSARIEYADTQMDNNWIPLTLTYQIRRNTLNGDLDANEAAHQFTLFGAWKLTGVDIGLFVNSFRSKLTSTYTEIAGEDTTRETYEDKLGNTTIGAGFSYKVSPRSRLDASIFYSSSTFANVQSERDTAQVKQPDGYSTIGFGARLFHVISPTTIVVPFVSYLAGGEGYMNLVEIGNWEKTYRDKHSQFILGLALDLIPFKNNLVTLATGYQHDSWTSEEIWFSGTPDPADKYASSILPFFSIGLESQLTNWLGVRFSYYELLATDKEETYNGIDNNLNEVKLTGNEYSANFGLWFKFGKFTIDALVDTNFLHKGPYVLSGSEYGTLFSRISVTYNFN